METQNLLPNELQELYGTVIGIEQYGYYYLCPLCHGRLVWSLKHYQVVCLACRELFDMEDIQISELNTKEVME